MPTDFDSGSQLLEIYQNITTCGQMPQRQKRKDGQISLPAHLPINGAVVRKSGGLCNNLGTYQ